MDQLKDLLTKLAQHISEIYDPTSWGECNEINATAAYVLKNVYHQDVELVSGFVVLDHPLDPDDMTEESVFDPRHMWIKFNHQILDFASLQFTDHIEDFPTHPYFLGNHENYKELDHHPLENEWVDKSLVQSWTES